MALKKYTCPPQGPAGSSTFSDDLVGFQLVTGGGLTQGNFEFATSFNEKTNRTFNTGTFSDPISLEGLGLENTLQSRTIFENNFKVYPKDLSIALRLNLDAGDGSEGLVRVVNRDIN
jgi:hypothetical protein